MTTIVQFPTNRIVREVAPNIEEIERAKEKSLQKHAESIVEDLVLNIMDALDNYGIDTETESFERDFTFTADGLRQSDDIIILVISVLCFFCYFLCFEFLNFK